MVNSPQQRRPAVLDLLNLENIERLVTIVTADVWTQPFLQNKSGQANAGPGLAANMSIQFAAGELELQNALDGSQPQIAFPATGLRLSQCTIAAPA